ncbi:MAG: dihydrofolate reductase [Nanohaloarchaea archaeon SW_7_46_7]|nr:MAG: dihydrofolate reductase [Nanohaloarchaea archaeon SW_7_46_7]
MKKIIIAAVSENRAIGKNGEIPWDIPEDMKHFKQTTMNHPVIMGRKTYQSFPKNVRPLPGRTNIVLTRSGFRPENESVKTANSLEEAYQIANQINDKAFVIGGASVYKKALENADEMILTEVHRKVDGDTFFPEWDKERWKETERDERDGYAFVRYERTNT